MLIYKNGVKNGVSTLLLFDKNGVPQHSLFDVKSENGVKNGVHTLFYMIAQIGFPKSCAHGSEGFPKDATLNGTVICTINLVEFVIFISAFV